MPLSNQLRTALNAGDLSGLNPNDNANWKTAFHTCILNGKLNTAKQIIELTTDKNQRLEMIHSSSDFFKMNNTLFTKVVEKGNCDILKYLIELTPKIHIRKSMMHSNDEMPFSKAIEYGRLDIANLLIELTPVDERPRMLKARDQYYLSNAAERGNHEILILLATICGDQTISTNIMGHRTEQRQKLGVIFGDNEMSQGLSKDAALPMQELRMHVEKLRSLRTSLIEKFSEIDNRTNPAAEEKPTTIEAEFEANSVITTLVSQRSFLSQVRTIDLLNLDATSGTPDLSFGKDEFNNDKSIKVGYDLFNEVESFLGIKTIKFDQRVPDKKQEIANQEFRNIFVSPSTTVSNIRTRKLEQRSAAQAQGLT